MNLITGLWGMNVHVPGQDVDDNLHWFFGVSFVLWRFVTNFGAKGNYWPQIIGCLGAIAVGGAWFTYKV
jgi:magnesium transporter